MHKHYILPGLNCLVGYEQLAFLTSIKIDHWELILCSLDYYAKGQDLLYQAYWSSYVMVLDMELTQPENYIEAKRLKDNLIPNRAAVDVIYQFVRDSLCVLMQQQGIPSNQFNNIAGISPGSNFFRVEIMDGTIY